MTPLRKSPFSYHFNTLLHLSAWLYETDSPMKENLFVVYKLIMSMIGVYGCYAMALDFYMVIGDLKRMAWNLCVSTMFMGSLGKNFQLLQRNHTINKLRMNLHRDVESRSSPEDDSINRLALKELKFLQTSFYGSAIIFIPVWLLTRFFRKVRELPVPLRLPIEVDLEDDMQYVICFLVVGFAGVVGLTLAIETELAMFGILIQISREYRSLLKDIPKLSEMYENTTYIESPEFNPRLRKLKAQMLIKKFSIRQTELIEYTKVFELCYNQPLLQQFFMIPILIVTLAIQCMMESIDLSGNIIYQLGYLLIIMVDLFLICWFSTTLKTQCYQVGETVYSTLWYGMEAETQRDLAMIILRSQHPPKLTTGKLMELSLNAFIHKMSNIYSWLALLRQLEFKFMA